MSCWSGRMFARRSREEFAITHIPVCIVVDVGNSAVENCLSFSDRSNIAAFVGYPTYMKAASSPDSGEGRMRLNRDDIPLGRMVTRREALALMGLSAAALLAARPGRAAPAAAHRA